MSRCDASAARSVTACAGFLRQRELRQSHDLAALERRLMRAQADAGPVGGLFGIGKRVSFLDERGEKFVHQMRM